MRTELARWFAPADGDEAHRPRALLVAALALALGFESSVRGWIGLALVAVLVAVLVVAFAAWVSSSRGGELLARLALSALWALLATAMGLASWSSVAPTPLMLSVPLTAFVGLRARAAWLASSVAALAPILLTPGGEAAFLAAGVMATAAAAQLQRGRSRAIEAALDLERRLRRQAEETVAIRVEASQQLLANVSHEMRTPLHGLAGLIELVLASRLPSTDRRRLEWARNTAELMKSLVDDLLDFDRIEQGRLVLRPQVFEVPVVVEEVVQLVRPRALSKRLHFAVSIDSQVPQRVIGDPRRLRQILLNLTSNAVKFTLSGGVSLQVALRPGGPSASGPLMVRFEVKDTGKGLAPYELARLFERYQRGSHLSERSLPSTGLGLAICRDLAEAMGGDVGVAANPEGGSVFWLDLPLAAAEGAASTTRPLAVELLPPPSHPLRAVLVEDDPVSRELAVAQLEVLGFETRSFERAEEALVELGSGSFDLLVLDVELPGMSGTEAVGRLRSRERLAPEQAPLRILAVTGRVLAEEHAELLAAGVDRCLTKPASLPAVREALEELLGFGLGSASSDGAKTESSDGPETWVPPRRAALETSETPVLDPERIADLKDLGARVQQPVLASLADGLRSRVPGLLDEIERSFESGDLARAKRLAHTIGGTAANIGAVRLAIAARALEARASRGPAVAGRGADGELARARLFLEDALEALDRLERPSRS